MNTRIDVVVAIIVEVVEEQEEAEGEEIIE